MEGNSHMANFSATEIFVQGELISCGAVRHVQTKAHEVYSQNH
jgi:hypothetical protein